MMIPAEKWYDYQSDYQKYGFDMEPKQPVKPKRVKKETVTAKEKMRLMIITVIVGVLFVGIIIANAYAASVKYGINDMVEQNAALQGEIENLTVKIHSANNIEAIEKKAIKQLGMVAPEADQCVYLAN